VELDLWDGADGRPAVTHGMTMCSKIPLVHALDEIAAAAFDVSPFPVILSLEDHLSPAQQAVAAADMKRILGEALLTAPLPGER